MAWDTAHQRKKRRTLNVSLGLCKTNWKLSTPEGRESRPPGPYRNKEILGRLLHNAVQETKRAHCECETLAGEQGWPHSPPYTSVDHITFVEGDNGNDPSAGSPTETLLRLLLPLNDQAGAISQ